MKKRQPLAFLLACFAGFALSCANGTVPGTGMTINHTNYDPASLSDAQVAAAAALDVYFEHASVGQDIVGNSSTDSSAGADSGGSDPCGLALLATSSARYFCDRTNWQTNEDGTVVVPMAPAWFDTHGGLADHHRGNPGGTAKVSGFKSRMTATLAGKIDVATFKFCWIDNPSNASALFSSAKAAMEELEASYPSVAFVWWTMPVFQSADGGETQRQAYNELVREYCGANDKWLLDIADLESHNDSGVLNVDGSGNELLVADYSRDGGHLNPAGKLKLAKAWWRLMAEIAAGK